MSGSDGVKCPDCDTTVVNHSLLRRHKYFFHRTEFSCDECKLSYNYPRGLKHHRRTIHGSTSNSDQSSNEENVQLNASSTENMVHCKDCGAAVTNQSELRNHRFTHHRTDFSCNRCQVSYNSSRGIHYHLRTNHSTQSISTSNSDQSTNEEDERNNFVSQDTQAANDKLLCRDCDTRSSNHSELRRHKYFCHRSDFSCDPCQVSYSSHRGLRHHLRTNHSSQSIATSNSDQSSTGGNDSPARQEEERVMPAKEKVSSKKSCSKCSMSFDDQEDLEKHRADTEGPVQCETCGVEIFGECYILQHQNNFHKDDSFPKFCPSCKSTFSSLFDWSIHFGKVHKEELNNFQCKICQRSFPTSEIATVHQQIHDDEKMGFNCDICDDDFETKGQLEMHKIIIHKKAQRKPKEKFECSECGKAFTEEFRLEKHLKVIHKTDPSPKKSTEEEEPRVTIEEYLAKKSLKTSEIVAPSEKNNNIDSPAEDDEKKFSCEICKRNFADESRLKIHLQIIHNIKSEIQASEKQVAEEVVKNIESKSSESVDTEVTFDIAEASENWVTIEERPMEEDTQAVCTFQDCKKSFKNETNLERHKSKFHGLNSEPISCLNCDLSFFYKFTLDRHILSCSKFESEK